MTGQEFGIELDRKTDRAFSAYFDPDKNGIILEALIKAIELSYPDATAEKNTDQLFSLIRTNVPYTPVSNQVNLITGITDYYHLLALKAKFQFPYNTQITGASNATPVVITVNRLLNLRDGDLVLIGGIIGNTSANGERYVKLLYEDHVNKVYAYQLFQDEKLFIPITPSGTYVSGGTIKRIIWKNWSKKKNSYRKISHLGQPTASNSFFEIADGNLKMLPDTEVCSEIRLDYIKKPTVLIDYQDNVIDLEITYPLRFLYLIADETAKLMGMSSRDGILIQNSIEEIRQP